jgi:hypothetical protein
MSLGLGSCFCKGRRMNKCGDAQATSPAPVVAEQSMWRRAIALQNNAGCGILTRQCHALSDGAVGYGEGATCLAAVLGVGQCSSGGKHPQRRCPENAIMSIRANSRESTFRVRLPSSDICSFLPPGPYCHQLFGDSSRSRAGLLFTD